MPSDQDNKPSRPAATEAERGRRREQVLTQPEPSKVRETAQAVVLKHGELFLLTNDDGDVPFERPHGLGLFYRDCRFLDGYILRLNDVAPTFLARSDARSYATYHELSNPELPSPHAGQPIGKNTIGIRRERMIRDERLREVLTVSNFGSEPAPLRLELRFRATFEDIFVLRGFVQDPRGKVRPPRVESDAAVLLRYEGRDGLYRTTELSFAPAPDGLEGERASYAWTLQPGERRQVHIGIWPREHREPQPPRTTQLSPADPGELEHWLQRSEKLWLDYSMEVRASNPLFDRVLRRCLLDLRVLRSTLEGKQYFSAGVPWFVTLFGRDSLITALQTLPYGPRIARDTLRLAARWQAQDFDEYRDAEPGKVLHELRRGELAHLDAIPQSPAYYGSVDATMLFLILLVEYVRWSGDLDLARELRPNVDAALTWMACYGDHDGDGYFDYDGAYRNGLVNQGWKDSGNAIVNADGSLATPPIALCEVQAYAYRAWRETAELLRALGAPEDRTADLEQRAERLRDRFERDFWSEDLGCYVLALQGGEKRPAAVATSNSGQVLWGRMAAGERAARVAERLLAPDMFSGWGVRTLSADEPAYNPISYHRGSVWPHDNGLIGCGLRHYGQDEAALRIFDALFGAAVGFTDFRLPELYCGYERRDYENRPVRYPVANSPQAWAAGAIPHMLWDLLGLRPDALHQRLLVERPCMPAWLDWLQLHGLPVGAARVDLHFKRDGARVQVQSEVREGTLRVEQTDTVAQT